MSSKPHRAASKVSTSCRASDVLLKRSRRAMVTRVSLLALFLGIASATANPFAAELISFQGPFGPSPYNDPQSILGEPATNYYEFAAKPNTRVKLFEATYRYSVSGGVTNRLLTTFTSGSFAIVRFDEPITNDPANPYGIDFLVFGNAFYIADNYGDGADLNSVNLLSGAFTEPLLISVSPGYSGQAGENANDPSTWPWFRYESGPFGDSAFPTHAYKWDRTNAVWTDEKMDFTKPVNPLLLETLDSGGLTAANAVELYTGSGGGTGFDLQESGFNSVHYVRIDAMPDSDVGEIDALSIVKPRVLGDTLSILPANITNHTARLAFQRPEAKSETALAFQFTALSDKALVSAQMLTNSEALAAIPATSRLAVTTEVLPLLGTSTIEFTVNLTLIASANYAGSGADLRAMRWDGTNWVMAPFTYDFLTRAATIPGITNAATFALMQFVAPEFTIRRTQLGFEFEFAPVPHCLHALERSTNLVNWTTLTAVTPTNREPVTLEDADPAADKAFYRLRLEMPEE